MVHGNVKLSQFYGALHALNDYSVPHVSPPPHPSRSVERTWPLLIDPCIIHAGDSVVNVYINQEKKFAFVEFRTVEETSNAMALDGIMCVINTCHNMCSQSSGHFSLNLESRYAAKSPVSSLISSNICIQCAAVQQFPIIASL